MSALTPVGAEERSLLAAARAGDGRAFEALVAAHQRALHLHCYRMLGSYDDAEEATQETLLSAWRGLATYEHRAPSQHCCIESRDYLLEAEDSSRTTAHLPHRREVRAALPRSVA